MTTVTLINKRPTVDHYIVTNWQLLKSLVSEYLFANLGRSEKAFIQNKLITAEKMKNVFCIVCKPMGLSKLQVVEFHTFRSFRFNLISYSIRITDIFVFEVESLVSAIVFFPHLDTLIPHHQLNHKVWKYKDIEVDESFLNPAENTTKFISVCTFSFSSVLFIDLLVKISKVHYITADHES